MIRDSRGRARPGFWGCRTGPREVAVAATAARRGYPVPIGRRLARIVASW